MSTELKSVKHLEQRLAQHEHEIRAGSLHVLLALGSVRTRQTEPLPQCSHRSNAKHIIGQVTN